MSMAGAQGRAARTQRMRRAAFALSGMLVLTMGCSSSATTDKDTATPADTSADVADTQIVDVPPGAVCVPGTTDGCATSQHVLRCLPDGSGYEAELCTDELGVTTACYNPGVCAQCQPGSRRCDPQDSTAIHECNGDGQWQPAENCDATKGLQCAAGGLCQKACDINVKAKSYVGCSFWATDLDNAFVPGGSRSYYDAAGAQYAVVVSNASDKLSTTITIEQFEGGAVEKVLYDSQGEQMDFSPLMPGELRVFNLPARNINATIQEKLAYRVTSSAPIAAYQFNPLENVNVYSNDASLLLPDELLGKYYIAMSREQSFSILRGFVTVVGTQGGKTNVSVTFSKSTGRTLGSQDGKIKAYNCKPDDAGATCSAQFVLDQWDVLNLESDEVGSDLTGTVVLADKRVAVFAGSEAANVPNTNHCLTGACTPQQIAKGEKCGVCEWDGKTACNRNDHCSAFITCCADHLEMQMFPVKTWGWRYVGVKLQPRGQELDAWRILAATDGTLVDVSPGTLDAKGKPVKVPVLDQGESYEFETLGSFELVARHKDGSPAPVMLGHFMASQDAPEPNTSGAQQGDAGTGDPAFLLAIPTDQWREDFVFLTPDKYASNYISIAAPIDAQVVFDGQPLAPDVFEMVPVLPSTDSTPALKYKMTRQYVSAGTHTVRSLPVNGEKRLVAVDVYGFDQYVSYGYPAGLDLKELAFIKEPGE